MPLKRRVLFVCIHNSARSQMAEAFLALHGGDLFIAESAGLEAGRMNPVVITAMHERGIDLSRKGTQQVAAVIKTAEPFDTVITVCDAASAERCPVFPARVERIAWSFEDPSVIRGEPDEVLNKTRVIRDAIESKIKAFVADARAAHNTTTILI